MVLGSPLGGISNRGKIRGSSIVNTPTPPEPVWTPADLFGASEHGFIADIQDTSTLFTDISQTTTADTLDYVASISNPVNSYPIQQINSDRRARLGISGGYRYLFGDGSNDYYSVNFGTSLSQPMTYVGVWISIVEASGNAYYYDGEDTNNRNSLIMQDDSQIQQWGGVYANRTTGYTAGNKEILFNEFNGAYSHLRVNENTVSGPSSVGPDGPGSRLYILSRYTIANFARHRLFWLMGINRVLTAQEQTDVHTYLKTHCGVTY